jgi:hypothetical protein
MKRAVSLIIVVCCLVACKKKEPYTGIRVADYLFTDSIFTRAGYVLDSNQQQVPYSNSTKTATSFIQQVGIDTQPGFNYCLIRTDTFWWNEALKHYGKPKPKHFSGDYVSVTVAGDSIQVLGEYQTTQSIKDSYQLLGNRKD